MIVEGDSPMGIGVCGCQRRGCSRAHVVIYALVALLHGAISSKYVYFAACPVLLAPSKVYARAGDGRHVGRVAKLQFSSLAPRIHECPAYLLSPRRAVALERFLGAVLLMRVDPLRTAEGH